MVKQLESNGKTIGKEGTGSRMQGTEGTKQDNRELDQDIHKENGE
ncbi:MAG: hypothetical protein PWQ77_2014 [Kosmotogales bacterium]|nr:hypothetical protein [Kosmotogales bacterium]